MAVVKGSEEVGMELLLYVADERPRNALASFLRARGHTVLDSAELAEAQAASAESRFDAALATFDAGAEALGSFFESCRSQALPLVIIARPADRPAAVALYEKGAFAVALEPVNVTELLAMLKRAEDRTAQAARRFTFDLLSGLDDGYVVLNRELKILFVNPRAAALCNKMAESLIGEPVGALGHADFEAMLEEASEGEEQVCFRRLRLGVGEKVVSARASVVRDGRGRRAGFGLHLRAFEELSAELWSHYSAARDALLQNIALLGPRGMGLLGPSLQAVDELRVPLVEDPIPFPASEALELAVRRAQRLIQAAPEVELRINDGMTRILCRRAQLEAMLTQLTLGLLLAGSNGVVSLNTEEEEVTMVFLSPGLAAIDLEPIAADPAAPHVLPVRLAAALARGHGLSFESLATGVRIRIPVSL